MISGAIISAPSTIIYNEEEFKEKHQKFIKRLVDLLPIMHNVRQRDIEITKEQHEKYDWTKISEDMKWELYKEREAQVAKEFNITEGDVDDIMIGDPFDWLVEEGIISHEELGRLW